MTRWLFLAILLTIARDLPLRVAFLAGANVALLFSLGLIAWSQSLTDDRVVSTQAWRMLNPGQRPAGIGGRQWACRHLRDQALLFAEAASAGDRESQRIYEVVGEALGIGLASLVSTLNLPLYIIGGGVVAAWELFAPSMFAELDRGSSIYRLTPPSDSAVPEAGKTNVLPAELGPDSGLLGAAMLPLFQSLSS